MATLIQPLEEKLARDGEKPYTVESAMVALQEKAARGSGQEDGLEGQRLVIAEVTQFDGARGGGES